MLHSVTLHKGIAAALLLAACLPCSALAQQRTLSTRTLLSGLQTPHGVAIHPATGDIYFSERATGAIQRYQGGSATPVIRNGQWRMDVAELPKWAISDSMPLEKWSATTLQNPGPITIASNGTLYVTEQIPEGRLLAFTPDEAGNYAVARPIPIPWLREEFQWRNVLVDSFDRLYIAGTDEVGPAAMKFGSCLVREPDGNWWVIDFGPFAQFNVIALSAREDVLLLGDARRGNLSWWEVNRHIMVGGNPETAGHGELQAVSVYPDGSFIIGVMEDGKARLTRMDPFVGQQATLADNFRSIGAIAIDREGIRYIVSDPVAGTLVECTPPQGTVVNEVLMRQIARQAEGSLGGLANVAEAPAFMNNFFERLQDIAKEIMPVDEVAAVNFTLSDIAGNIPIIAGRVRTVVNVQGVEEDPLEQLEFFLIFPSKMIFTDETVTPSLSFFYAKRKSGKIEQTKAVFNNSMKAYRISGTNRATIGTSKSGLFVPVVSTGMEERNNGIYISISFLGMGIFPDYFLSLYQGVREQSARLVVKDPQSRSGYITYEATFMDEATIAGMQDRSATREEISNLLVSGFGNASAGGNRSIGWLRLGQYPADKLVSFADTDTSDAIGAASGDLKEIITAKEVELRREIQEEIAIFHPDYVPQRAVEEDDETILQTLFGEEAPATPTATEEPAETGTTPAAEPAGVEE